MLLEFIAGYLIGSHTCDNSNREDNKTKTYVDTDLKNSIVAGIGIIAVVVYCALVAAYAEQIVHVYVNFLTIFGIKLQIPSSTFQMPFLPILLQLVKVMIAYILMVIFPTSIVVLFINIENILHKILLLCFVACMNLFLPVFIMNALTS